MASQRNPQADQMADESMIRTLSAQAQAIWPQEVRLFERYALAANARIADIGCGTGEATSRIAARYPEARIVGVDILESSIDYARRRHATFAGRVEFVRGDAFALDFPADSFDLVVCRHLTQCVPEPEAVLAELKRICKPGGWLHILSEDYGMLHLMAGELDPDRFWHEGLTAFARNTGTDPRIGRRTWSVLRHLGIEALAVDYVIVDTLRVSRHTFAAILEAWRDGYADAISRHSAMAPVEVRAYFDYMIGSISNPDHYAVWHVPVVSGRLPSLAVAR